MTNKWVRIALLVLGILMVILGIAMISTPIANTLVMTYVVCALMLVLGIAEIVFYCMHRKSMAVSGWALADGIISAVLGLWLISRPDLQVEVTIMLFTFWVLFTGVTRTASSFAAKDAGIHGWGWILAAGIVGILVGLYLMFHPLLAALSVGMVLPIAFIGQGVSMVIGFFSKDEL